MEALVNSVQNGKTVAGTTGNPLKLEYGAPSS